MKQRQSPQQMVMEQLDIHVLKKKNLDTDLMPVTKTNSKWIIGLNVKCQMQSFKTPKR